MRLQLRLAIGLVVLFVLVLPACVNESKEFSFLVIGDTRSEPYLALTKSKAEMVDILRHRYHGTKVELELKGNKPVKATIHHPGKPLILHYNETPWPQRIEEFHNQAYRQIYTRKGFDWVTETAVKDLNTAGATQPAFLIHGGDLILNGYLGRSLDSPYWALLHNNLLKHLPQRVYAAVGNHETWEDTKLEGMMAAMPWLKEVGFRVDHQIYSFDKANSRFIFLNTGPQCETEHGNVTDWCSIYPDYPTQMVYLRQQMEEAKQDNLKNIFVTYHKPSYIKVGHDPLPADKNPHQVLKTYANDFNIVVFNSHAHTTEHYLIDGVGYFVIGGGGAPQAFDATTNPSTQTELYWKGAARTEEYNILKVSVAGGHLKASLHRLRPGLGVSNVPLLSMKK